MKTLQEIFQQPNPTDIIRDLKVKRVKVKPWSDLIKEYEPMQHRVFTDPNVLPDKPIYNERDELIRMEPATKVAVGLQKLATKRMGEFMFTLPVTLVCENAEDMVDEYKAFRKVLKRNRWDALNKRRCRINSSQCEQATYWYLVKSDTETNHYGFKSKFKVKHQIFSPENGDALYPLFDDTGDMIAFSRETTIDKTIYFDCWTSEKYYQWQKKDSIEWEKTKDLKNDIKKIPISYSYRPKPIWEDADNGKVHEIELLLSRNGEVIAYHSSPVLVLSGEIQGAPTKGAANKVFYTKDGKGGAQYVSWEQSPETVRFQFDTLLRLFFTELQLPDLSLENIKGLGATSGDARRWLLADAHLKVGDESEIYSDLMDREFSIIKAFLAVMNPDWADTLPDMDIVSEINPFTIQSDKENIEVIIAANGGKPVISQETSVQLAGLVEDVKGEYEKLMEEGQAEANVGAFDSTE